MSRALVSLWFVLLVACESGGNSGSGDAAGGRPCSTPADCRGFGFSDGDQVCRGGHCTDCANDSDCGSGRCDQQRCFECLTDYDCPVEAPRCRRRSDFGTATQCWGCVTSSDCEKGTFCPPLGMSGQGSFCEAGSCSASLEAGACRTCLGQRGLSTCTQCKQQYQAQTACLEPAAAKGCYYPSCCAAEVSSLYDCLRDCIGDACD